MKASCKIVAEICLYGTSQHGAGWLARTADGRMLGDGELLPCSFTEAVWLAADTIRQVTGSDLGLVRIFASGGQLMADAPLRRVPSFGSLEWKPATVLVISAEAIMEAAEKS